MRRPTLNEKRYGEGFREGPSPSIFVKSYKHCAVDTCDDPVYGTMEIFVDDAPVDVDWYSKLMRLLQEKYPHAWVVTPFCKGHLEAVVRRATDVLDEPDLWAPGRNNPPVLPRPPKVLPSK
jgi:hypothetical protein